MTSLPNLLILSRTFFSKESTIVNTVTTAKIPIVTPSKDKKVLNLLLTMACHAKRKLSKKIRSKIKMKIGSIKIRYFEGIESY